MVVPVLLKGDAGYLLPPSVLAKGEAGTLCFFKDGGTPWGAPLLRTPLEFIVRVPVPALTKGDLGRCIAFEAFVDVK